MTRPSSASALNYLQWRNARFIVGAAVLGMLLLGWWLMSPKNSAPPAKPVADAAVQQSLNDDEADPDIARYNEAIRLNPADATAFTNRAVAYQGKGQHQRALRDFAEAIRLRPDDAEKRLDRGVAFYDAGQYAEAIKDLDDAIRLKPDFVGAYNVRGLAYDSLGKVERAILDYDQALRIEPVGASVLLNRGMSYAKQGQHERAIKDYDESIRIRPDPRTYARRGEAYFDLGQLDRAIAENSTALQLKPDHVPALNDRCWYRALANEDLADALSDCDRALSLKDSATTHQIRGLVEFRLGHYREAIADYDEAIKREPKSPYARYMRGLAKRRFGRVAEGDADIAAGKAIDSDVSAFYARYGVTP